jgi:diguanylate cyclase (GGDEF)-like protein
MHPNKIDQAQKNLEKLFLTIGKAVTSSIEEKVIINTIMRQIELFFKPANWSFLRLDSTTNELYFVVAKGISVKNIKSIRFRLGEGIVGKVAKTGKPMLIQDVRRDPNFNNKIDKLSGFKTQSIIAAPLIFNKKILGVIELINSLEKKKFNKRALRLLEAIADFSAIALNNSIAYEKMKMLAKHDPLTQLFNRSYLEEILKTYQKKLSHHTSKNQYTKKYAVAIFVDINYLKHINDHYGHQAGDDILCGTAKFLKACCRKNDVAFRVGGDEFLLLIMDLHPDDVEKISARLKKQMETYANAISSESKFAFGIASGVMTDLKETIMSADRMMYENKSNNSQRLHS